MSTEKKLSDTEIKFISTANTQIKFYNKQFELDVFNKIEKLLTALDIEIKERTSSFAGQSLVRIDAYFDDDWRLADSGCSLSIRSYRDGKTNVEDRPDVLILKHNETKGRANGLDMLRRNELRATLTPDETAKLKQDGISQKDLARYFPNNDLPLEGTLHFKNVGHTKIRRSTYMVADGGKPYRISVDRYYFFSRELNKYSEVFNEIEIDNQSDGVTFNPNIRKLAEIIDALFEIEPEPVSKYQRFKEFCVVDDFEDFYFLGFDIVSYSTGRSWVQKQIVQRFHKILKDQLLRTGFSKQHQPVKISIGDGAVIAARADWTNLVRLIHRIRAAVERNNAKDPLRQIEYRTAIHYGPVFRFTDLNGLINVAGSGINIVSRILNEAEKGEIFLSREAYQRVVDGAPTDVDQFTAIGNREVKHGVIVELYRFIDKSPEQ